MDGNRVRKARIEIPIPFKRRPYRSGDGPALAPIRIALENESNAFIIDRRVRPGTPINNELRLEMYYIVGWPDLPTVRLAVLATKIYDYVSPRTVEDWEYNLLLEQDKEREEREEREAEAMRRAKKVALGRTASTPAASTPKPGTPMVAGQNKRGRPSKADMPARRMAQQASFDDADMERVEASLPPTQTSGPSLSTPQKRLAAELITPVDDLDDNEHNAIFKQLNGEDTDMDANGRTWGEDEDEDEEEKKKEEEEEEEEVDLLEAPTRSNFFAGLSQKGYAYPFIPNSLHTSNMSSNRDPPRPTSNTPVPAPSYPRPKFKKKTPWSPRSKLTTPVPVPTVPRPPLKQLLPPRVKLTTPVPVPYFPAPKPKILLATAEKIETPVPVPAFEELVRNGARSAPQPRSTFEHHGFTPAGRSSGRWPTDSITVAGPDSRTQTLETPLKPRPRSHKKPRTPPPKEDEPVWEVKRLEGDKVVEIDGARVRYFIVRWEGNWPPDQNPTWEPESFIAPPLVKQYLKKKASKGDSSSAANTPIKVEKIERPMSTLKRKYSSVAEAFEGTADEEDPLHVVSPARAYDADVGDDADDDGVDRLRVTERDDSPPMRYSDHSFDAALMMKLASTFRSSALGSGP
ncbi:Uu.00g042150.m01.CDS01 [Anthostomella pinea]|uniref:Uu.00g042150.m01.CDS01 n=1 Tax=Anthostomella pinea TaxID=933095 RepID=A0AAI8YE40_9PEZI|nr:Uu.00g042150.m01.CDS01 [Anthostomella pinea]